MDFIHNLDWIGLIGNFIAILFGLALFIIITNTKWGKKHTKHQYAIMLFCVLMACLFGWGLKFLIGKFF